MVIVALILVVLLGLVGLAVDAGAMFDERRQLSNGADAAALAVAADCAVGVAPCDASTAYATADQYADSNARDGAAGIDSLELDLSEQTIHVVTHTVDGATGDDKLKPFFMQLLGFDGTRVVADATAKWGVPRSLDNLLPLVVSDCEWPGGVPFEVTIYFHGGAQVDEALVCNALPGHDRDEDGELPGGFGWLDAEGGCQVDIESGTWIPNEPGVAIPNGCKDLIEVGNTVFVPWFSDSDGVRGQGQGDYFVEGFGAFEIDAFRFPGHRSPGVPPCTGSAICIRGTFTTAMTNLGEFGGGTNHGVVMVKLID